MGLLVTDESALALQLDLPTIRMGPKSRPEAIARDLFRNLRAVDKLKVDVVVAEGIDARGVGLAVMNRLRRRRRRGCKALSRCRRAVGKESTGRAGGAASCRFRGCGGNERGLGSYVVAPAQRTSKSGVRRAAARVRAPGIQRPVRPSLDRAGLPAPVCR